MSEFSVLQGKTLKKVEVHRDGNSDCIAFTTVDGEGFVMNHIQDCCESVVIEDIIGNLEGLVGDPLLLAEEVEAQNVHPEDFDPMESDLFVDESFTWTFYKLATVKDYATIRWFGCSNGYYSESVNFVQTV